MIELHHQILENFNCKFNYYIENFDYNSNYYILQSVLIFTQYSLKMN